MEFRGRDYRTWLGLMALLLVSGGSGGRASGTASSAQAVDPDDYRIQVIYALPSDGESQGFNQDGTLAGSVAVAQEWLAEQTDGRQFRFVMADDGVSVKTVRLSRTDAELQEYGDYLRDQIEYELLAQGLADPTTIYAVYYEGGGLSCGYGPGPPELPGNTVIFVLRGTPENGMPCAEHPFASPGDAPGYLEFGLMHELFHAVGAVPECAPNEDGGNHVDDIPQDLLYAGMLPWEPTDLDPGRDDYYDHGQDDCLDAARSVFLDPPTVAAELPPVWFNGLIEMTSCDEGSSRSSASDTETFLQVVNTTDEMVQLVWLDDAGEGEVYGEIGPWESFDQGSYAGHAWILVDEDGDCLAAFDSPDDPARAVLR